MIDMKPEALQACRELEEVLDRWRERAIAGEHPPQAYLITHAAVLGAYALSMTKDVEPEHAEEMEKLRDRLLDGIQPVEQGEAN